jgi:hypothetical protein
MSIFGGKSAAFVEQRGQELNLWMKQTMKNCPEVLKSKEFHKFVAFKGDVLQKKILKEKRDAAAAAQRAAEEEEEAALKEEKKKKKKGRQPQHESRMGDSGLPAMVCPYHSHQSISLYCMEKQALCCASCIIPGGSYAGMKCMDVKEKASQAHAELCDKVAIIREKEKIKEVFHGALQEVRANVLADSAMKQEAVRMAMDQLQNFLMSKEDELIESVQEEVTKRMGLLHQQLQEQHSLGRSMVRVIKTTDNMLAQQDPVAFLLTWGAEEKNEVEERLDEMNQAYIKQEPCVPSELPLTVLVDEEIGQSLMYSEIQGIDFMESAEWQAAMRERDATKFELEEAASEKAGLEEDFERLSASEVVLTTQLEDLKAQVAAAKAERAEARAQRAAREIESSVAASETTGKPSDVSEATDAAAGADEDDGSDVGEFAM